MTKVLLTLIELCVIAILTFIILKFDIKYKTLSEVIFPLSVTAAIVFIPLAYFTSITGAEYVRKAIGYFCAFLIVFAIVIPLILFPFILNHNLREIFHSSEIWHLLLSYYYRLIVVYLLLFSFLTHLFTKRLQAKNISGKSKKCLILYFLFLVLFPIFLSKVISYKLLI